MFRNVMRLLPLALVYASNPSSGSEKKYTIGIHSGYLRIHKSVCGDAEIAKLLDSIDEKTKVKFMILKDRKLTKIPENINDFKNLKNLLIEDNQIQEINPKNFIYLPLLEDLTLKHNKIKTIDGLANIELPNLQNLRLSKNQIETIDPNVFLKFPKLSELKLNDNYLKTLPRTILGLKHLSEIYIQGNPNFSLYSPENGVGIMELAKKFGYKLYLDKGQRIRLKERPSNLK